MVTQYSAAPFLFAAAVREKYRPGLVSKFLHALGLGAPLAAVCEPVDDVQRILYRFVDERHADSSLSMWWDELGLNSYLTEWRILASTPANGDWGPALLAPSSTPGVWAALQRIFVLMIHATRVESSVSKQKQLEHSNMKGNTVCLYLS